MNSTEASMFSRLTIFGDSHEFGNGLMVSLHIVTLNCWAIPQPWPIGSRHRRFRLQELAKAMSAEHYDIVALQEVWSEKDFLALQEKVKDEFPFNYYFHSGFTGSGVCVFSRYTIVSTLMHRYSLNGFAHHIHRGDWFGGKVVGMIEIEIGDYRINFYTTHLHAEYDRENDLYLPHRISQAFELSQFVKHTSYAADAIILTGDFNIEPFDLGYRLIINNADLKDAWLEKPNRCEDDGMTCDRRDNCYTSAILKRKNLPGKRLDYIMYREGRSEVELIHCENKFNHIPCDESINYSDHIGVYAEIKVSSPREKYTRNFWLTPPDLLKEAIHSTDEGEKRVLFDRRLFLGLCFVLTAVLAGTIKFESYYTTLEFLIRVVRFFITLFIGFCLWHGVIGLTIELKALKAAKASMEMLLND